MYSAPGLSRPTEAASVQALPSTFLCLTTALDTMAYVCRLALFLTLGSAWSASGYVIPGLLPGSFLHGDSPTRVDGDLGFDNGGFRGRTDSAPYYRPVGHHPYPIPYAHSCRCISFADPLGILWLRLILSGRGRVAQGSTCGGAFATPLWILSSFHSKIGRNALCGALFLLPFTCMTRRFIKPLAWSQFRRPFGQLQCAAPPSTSVSDTHMPYI